MDRKTEATDWVAFLPIGEVHTLRKFLVIIGGLFLVLVLVGAGFLGYAAYRGRDLDASSKAYVEENIPAIVSTWSKDELLKRMSPQDDEERARGGVRREYSAPQATRENWSQFRYLSSNGPFDL
jgi:hypothetical protein